MTTEFEKYRKFCKTYTNIEERTLSFKLGNFAHDRVVITELHKNAVLFGGKPIYDIQELVFVHGELSPSNIELLPRNVKHLNLCKTIIEPVFSLKNITFKSKTMSKELDNLFLERVYSIEKCIDIEPCQNMTISFYYCDNFNYIQANDTVGFLDVSNCARFTCLEQCAIDNVISAKFSGLKTLKTANTKFKSLALGCDLLSDFTYVESLDVELNLKLQFIDLDKIGSIINLMSHNALSICITDTMYPNNTSTTGKTFSDVANFQKIMNKNLCIKNRKEYIMNCALELIENGFENGC